MSYADYRFLKNCQNILINGTSDDEFNVRPKWADGTLAHTKKIIHNIDYYFLSKESIPVMTLRKSGFKNAIDEILWIYQKKSNNLSDLNSHIWDSWNIGNNTIGKAYGYQVGIESKHHKYTPGEDLSGIIFKSIDGWIYLSQIDAVIWDLKNNPGSRSIITNLYNHQDLSEMGLRPCAYSMTFNVTYEQGQLVLNGILNQRSQDMLTANNWNVIQYSILLQMLAQVCHMRVGRFTHVVADMHIYDRHESIVQEMINIGYKYGAHLHYDKPFPNPKFIINPDIDNFYEFTTDDFALENYEYLPFEHVIEVAI